MDSMPNAYPYLGCIEVLVLGFGLDTEDDRPQLQALEVGIVDGFGECGLGKDLVYLEGCCVCVGVSEVSARMQKYTNGTADMGSHFVYRRALLLMVIYT